MFKGSLVALITPMRHDGSVDEAAFAAFIDWQIGQGTNGVVPVGTTGESPTLTHKEHRRVVEIAVEAAAGRVPVIAGAGANSTAEAIAYTQHARQAGADAALVVTPYYNKPTQAGLELHYRAIADAVDLPIIIYNIPSRSVVDMSVATMARLAKHPNIVGVKDSTANRTIPRCPSSPPAVSVASASPPTSPRRCAAKCTAPGRPARSAAPSASRTACSRCTTPCSLKPTPPRSNTPPACSAMAATTAASPSPR